MKKNTVAKLSAVTVLLESCSGWKAEPRVLTHDPTARSQRQVPCCALQARQCFCKVFRHSSPSAHPITSKGGFWNENICRAYLCQWRPSNKVSLMPCICEQRKLKSSYWISRANNNLDFLLGALTNHGCICMSIICYIFRYTKTYIFNQKETDINLNILNL